MLTFTPFGKESLLKGNVWRVRFRSLANEEGPLRRVLVQRQSSAARNIRVGKTKSVEASALACEAQEAPCEVVHLVLEILVAQESPKIRGRPKDRNGLPSEIACTAHPCGDEVFVCQDTHSEAAKSDKTHASAPPSSTTIELQQTEMLVFMAAILPILIVKGRAGLLDKF
jgi:hypothetical protein